MSVLTEAALRVLLKDEDLNALAEYRVDDDVIVTPSAKAYLIDHKIDLIVGGKRIIRNPGSEPKNDSEAPKAAMPQDSQQSSLPPFEKPDRYESIYGGTFAEKPEHMTALRGTTLVFKDHKLICLRGKLDSLEARILEVQLAFHKQGLAKIVADLGGVLDYVKEMLRCEVLGEPLGPMHLLGMDEDEIRARSHTPKKYYGMPHFSPSLADGEAVVLLNTLRTQVREAEIAAYEAFKDEYGIPERGDIIQGFNRLSSVFYVMMFKAKAKEYDT